MNKELAGIGAKTVKAMIEADQALTLKEFAVGFGYTYRAAKDLAKCPGFPMLSGRIFGSDFKLWRRRQLGLQSAPDGPARRRQPAADRFCESPLKHG